MKNFIFCVTALLSISMMGCKTGIGSQDPKAVLSDFFDALQNKDIATARKYATKESDQMLNMIETAMKMAPDSAKQKDYDKKNMEFGDAVIDGDRATVPMRDKRSGETTNFVLKKQDNSWKVAFDKETMTEMGKEKMKGMKNKHLDGLADSSKKMLREMNKMTDSLTKLLKTDSMK
ncbi:MAG: hypothetical protein ABJA57_04510 [Ginsengibacter sp.]